MSLMGLHHLATLRSAVSIMWFCTHFLGSNTEAIVKSSLIIKKLPSTLNIRLKNKRRKLRKFEAIFNVKITRREAEAVTTAAAATTPKKKKGKGIYIPKNVL
ncbi:hypothetical protein B0T20DRAFT_396175 [Sordaria brevicollis]|uniref:Uncharacterized protein n=1 Tax=Sordaria brevicollis TaxID=83679 RepID=A0AAE0U6C3_SORBR|nr:hypothetical protein B0T20DRAFT_396175 [Sordaria brevicollis]